MKRLLDYLKMEEVENYGNLDGYAASLLHEKIIQKKPFLKQVYLDFYNYLKETIPNNIDDKFIIELGSGGGFAKEIIPTITTSDIIDLPNVDKLFSVLDMPFEDNSVDAFFMLNVFHHFPDADAFLRQADRCLKVGGKIAMIEPANTFWGRVIWNNFHHEPFDPSGLWTFDSSDPLFSANSALPWIVFCRDADRFNSKFPFLKILKIEYHSPLKYLLSGGVSMKALLPFCMYNTVKVFEMILSPFSKYFGMFMTVEIEKIGANTC